MAKTGVSSLSSRKKTPQAIPFLEWPMLSKERVWMIAVALVLMVAYGLTMPRTVTLEDSGLFLMACHFWGVAHPPGYPLYTLLGKGFEVLLPFGEPAWRIHCLSAFLGIVSCLEVFWLARCFQMHRLAAVTAALALGLSRTFWSQAQIAEVYTLNTALFFGCAVAVTAFCVSGSTPTLLIAAALAGLGVSNHWPLFILSSPLLLGVAWPAIRSIGRRWVVALLVFTVGLSPWVYLVIRSRQNPFINFYGPLESGAAVFHFLARQGYEDTTQTSVGWFALGPFLGSEFLGQFGLVGAGGVVIGITAAVRRWPKPQFFGALGGFSGATAVLLALLHAEDTELNRNIVKVFPLIPYAIAALWLGEAVAMVCRFERLSGRTTVVAIGAGALLTLQLVVNYPANNLRRYTWARDYGEAVLRTAPTNAIVVTHLDFDAGPVGYVRYLLGKRPDVELMNDRELIFGNRLNTPFASEPARRQRWLALARSTNRPVTYTDIAKESICRALGHTELAVIDRGLLKEFDRNGKAGSRRSLFEPDADRYLEKLQVSPPSDFWTRLVDGVVRERLHRWVETAYTQDDSSWPPEKMKYWLDQLPQSFDEKLRWIGARPLDQADRMRVRQWISEAAALATASTPSVQRAKLANFQAILAFAEGRDAEGERGLRESAFLHPKLEENPAVFNWLQHLAQKGRKQEFMDAREKLIGNRPVPDRYVARMRALDEQARVLP